MSLLYPTAEARIMIKGPSGLLELLTTPASIGITSIICHPHPLMGGTLDNKVVTTLARTLRDLGHATVRLNFRGVGQSQGEYGNGIGETADLLAVIDWVKHTRPGDKIVLAGFSFGSFVALRAASLQSCEHLIVVAPPVHYLDFTTLTPPSCPWVVVMGDADEVVIPELVFSWAAQQSPAPTVIKMAGASHFFHGRLIELRELLTSYLKNHANT